VETYHYREGIQREYPSERIPLRENTPQREERIEWGVSLVIHN